MLRDQGYRFRVIESGIDDAALQPGSVSVEQWTAALAYLKARAGSIRVEDMNQHGLVIGADTLVEQDGAIIGQPRDLEDARNILRRLAGRTHRVITGVAIVESPAGARDIFVDSAEVHVGPLSDEEIEAYLAGEQWKGKAGAYNLCERVEAGWPIHFQGDATTIMGLPMALLRRHLARRWKTTPAA